ncbi:MAG: flagellar biosynthesis protein FlgA [Nitrospirae bacterium CG18_big_fil_WC_8_21_14_2_50_70_55]|nr:flagellar basal body P-ring protein FlgI [Deltaproteobacteria bacterium]PIQ05666.1 MAG: flagellar biosynthesis protein FlgA [Nitrospirae bacterium CG18_big_fil_WC_8_21_14_2_50_70_55]PIU77244.1 MAG: flagellar biosynthesis protein FlgA [Nitrospirae bacterium CG06_land_8_20_14_3_00_70_43]PIW82731.1 MAG: flagellar biosynthesis protein FlgA [Nitrospirae bacterium CG_4_8_14_3_um_filter_70_85]PIX82550.1 MAG: flagellar biosynthesis protein FlgA [Nitrospirae bacterium CG_4_10_14_3_um_filter_70_108]P
MEPLIRRAGVGAWFVARVDLGGVRERGQRVAAAVRGLLFGLLVWVVVFPTSAAATRLKDVAELTGVRSNQLIGYGLVVGLDGTGDGVKSTFTRQSLTAMLDRLGVNVDAASLKVENIAAVMVTADLPPFAHQGSHLDVTVSSIGDCESLRGGTLLMTPLKAADNGVYAVAQGAVSIGGFSFGGRGGGGVQKNHPTTGRIVSGGLVEREVEVDFGATDRLRYGLRHPDFTTAERLAAAINEKFGSPLAMAADAGTVEVQVPEEFLHHPVPFAARLEGVEVAEDRVAKVILNERTGTVVMGSEVRLSTVAIAHGGLSISIKETPLVSQPAPLSLGGTTVQATDSQVQVQEEERRLMVVAAGVSLAEVVGALNALGVTPGDLIAILQALQAAGALHAELEII